MDGLIKVYHKRCGGHIGWIKDRTALRSDSSNFYLLNMTHPIPSEMVKIGCLTCGKYVTSRDAMTII